MNIEQMHNLNRAALEKVMFYRVHWKDCPQFSVENAKSLTWADRENDGASDCSMCLGVGEIERRGELIECAQCDGSGQVAIEPEMGYSCCESADDLVAYFESRSRIEPDPDTPVVVFEGARVGTGYDDEPLVVPKIGSETWTTWAELKESL